MAALRLTMPPDPRQAMLHPDFATFMHPVSRVALLGPSTWIRSPAVDNVPVSHTHEEQPAAPSAVVVRLRGALCAAAAFGVLCATSHGVRAGAAGFGADEAAVWAAAPTTVNAVVAAPAVTSPGELVTSFSVLLVAIVVLVTAVRCRRRVVLSRFGGLYGP